MKIGKVIVLLTLTLVSVSLSGCAVTQRSGKLEPMVIQEQGSFAVGGTVISEPGTFDPIQQGAYNPKGVSPVGQTLHGDHASVFYQTPENARQLPLVFWHGHGQSAKTWETTPDGREGFQNIFLRQRFGVYLIDQPRRGRAARSTEATTINATPDEQLWFGISRLGAWPNFYEGVQFSKAPEALNQFFRQMVPNTGPYNAEVNIAAVSELFKKIGKGILVTHSQSGGPGWRTVTPSTVPMADFMRLTKIPIIVYYGDNIPKQPSQNPGQEQWRAFLEVAKTWRDVVNSHGGDVTLVHLPELGIRGNTHLLMSDLNNLEIADLMSGFLKKKGLDCFSQIDLK